MHKKVSIAVLGCGKIAHNHLQAIIDNQKDFNLVSVCDNNSSLAEQAGEKYNIPFFSDLEIMLKTIADIEIVSICTPSGLHAQQSILISQYGKHVITEKPMACEISDARTMIDAAQKNQKKLFVVKQNRLSPTIQALKKAIDGEDFGKIYLVHSNIFWMRPQAYYDQASWRGTRRYDGGALMNQASHYVDLLEYLLGPVDSVQAMTRTLGRKIETEDTAVVNLSWKNGAIGSMAVTMLTYPKNIEGSITVIGEKGTASLDGSALNEVRHWYFENADVDNPSNTSQKIDNIYSNGHGLYYKNVADVLLRNAEAISDGSSGIKSVELLCAIYESASTGKQISMMDYIDTIQDNASLTVE